MSCLQICDSWKTWLLFYYNGHNVCIKMKLVGKLEQHNYYKRIRCASKDDDTEVDWRTFN